MGCSLCGSASLHGPEYEDDTDLARRLSRMKPRLVYSDKAPVLVTSASRVTSSASCRAIASMARFTNSVPVQACTVAWQSLAGRWSVAEAFESQRTYSQASECSIDHQHSHIATHELSMRLHFAYHRAKALSSIKC